jgi:predicted  nucleic acid-binding Zn-ribbon protein
MSIGVKLGHISPLATMPPITESETKELRDLVIGLREEIRVGFAQVDIKFAQVDTKLAEINGNIQALDQKLSGSIQSLDQKISGEIKTLDQKVTGIDDRLKSQENKLTQIDTNQRELTIQFTEMKGELKIVRQPIEFWEFVKRAVVSGLTVTVAGGLLLAAWKLVIFGTMKV